jgi:hypothetical protein
MKEVTDPDILRQLEGGPREVTDPAILKELEGNRYTGSVLPFSIGPDGKAQFDSNAGILGGIKRAFTYPADVAAGRKAVPETMGGENNPAADAGERGGYPRSGGASRSSC